MKMFAVISLVCILLVSQRNNAATIQRDLGYLQGRNYATRYNAGSYRLYPESVNINESEYDYFSENMDFDTIKNRILVGAADKLFLMDLNLNVVEGGEFVWSASPNNSMACNSANANSNPGYLCRNHIRLYKRVPAEPNLLYVCGSQATYTAQCRGLNVSGNTFGDATPPTNSSYSIISTHPDYPSFGTFRNSSVSSSSADPAFLSWNYMLSGSAYDRNFDRQDILYNSTTQVFTNSRQFGVYSRWLDKLTYIVDIIPLTFPRTPTQDGINDFYFVFLRERHQFQLANSDSEPLILSRVLRICKDDPGVLLRDNMTRAFGTLFKTRIYCNQMSPRTKDNPLAAVEYRYNDLWSVSLNGDRGRYRATGSYSMKMYGAFSTPLVGPVGSVICVYIVTPGMAMGNRGLFDTFNGDINVRNETSNTFREVENNYRTCTNTARPATDPGRITAEDIDVRHDLLQIGENPLIVFEDVYITKMVVDETCVVTVNNPRRCLNQDVLFVGTNTGKIRKVVFAEVDRDNFAPIVAEEITLEDNNFVKDLEIRSVDGVKYLFATTKSHIYKLSLERCSRHVGLRTCVQSRDPYCMWNADNRTCQFSNLLAPAERAMDVPSYLKQNIHRGFIQGTLEVGFSMTSYTASERESSLDVTIVANDTATVPNGWLQLEVIEPGTEALKYGPVNVSFSSMNSSVISLPILEVYNDSLLTGSRNFTLRLTTNQIIVFSVQKVNLTITEDDGILAQIGMKDIGEACNKWIRNDRFVKMEILNNAILKGVTQRSLPMEIIRHGLHCNPDQNPLEEVAIYRFSLRGDPFQLRSDLNSWVIQEETIKFDIPPNPLVEVKVDGSCNTNIATLQDNFCTVVPSPGGLGQTTAPAPAPATVGLSVIVVLLVVVIVALVVIIMVVVIRLRANGNSRKRSQDNNIHLKQYSSSGSATTDPEKKEDLGKKDSPTSDELTSSLDQQRSPLAINSAAPLICNGVEQNQFNFALQNPPLSRKNSPVVKSDDPRLRVTSDSSAPTTENGNGTQDIPSSGVTYQNVNMV